MEKYELTNPQKSIWVTELFYKGTSIENIAGSTIINSPVDFGKLKMAINLFIKKAESFRLKLTNEEGTVKQYISDYEELSFSVVTLNSEKDVKKLEKEFASTPFKIYDSLLFKFKLFKLKDERGGFIISGHHLLVDAWSCGLVISSIMEIYELLLRGEEYNKEIFSYVDYIKSEKDYLKSNRFTNDKAFWEGKFKTVSPVASIPGSINGNTLSSVAKRKAFKISVETMNFINSFCKQNKVSLFNFFMGIYSIYLSKVSNLNEFVIGTPVLNRSNSKEKHTVGMFISVVPFKVTINHENSFADFAYQISADFFNIFKHQKYPYQMLLENLRKQNSNIPNLYNIMLSYQNMRTNTNGAYETSWTFNGNISDDIDIHFFDINDSGVIDVAYDYKTSKYTAEDIYALHSRILHIINQILENNSILLKDIEIITPDEKNEILFKFNNTKMDYPKDKTIVELFEAQVEKTPNNIALVFENKKLTYKELNERANSLACYLRETGITKNSLVGIMVHRSLEMIIAILAVLKAGGAYIPIDPTYPKDRIEYMLENSCAAFLLTQKVLKDKIDFKNKIFIDLENTKLYSHSNSNLEHINVPQDLAYVIFTSGSTGMPKGVMLKHQNVVNFNFGMQKEFCFSPKDTIVCITTISFDIFVLESIVPLLNGLKVVIANEDEQVNVDLFNQICIENNVNIIQTTPSRMQMFVLNNNAIDFIKNANYILIGGEPFPSNLLKKFKEITNAKIYNMYGPTETTVWSSIKNLSNTSSITIGKPIANTQIYILDKNLKPLPIGVCGELYIAGDGVGKGYLNNCELTKKSFVNNPFISNEIMYKTGDIGIFNSNLEIVCLGRIDNQVKIRGFRIELGEIEEKLSEFPAIKSCAVAKKQDNASLEFLCAYYTSNNNIDTQELRNHLSKSLPTYMIPQYFVNLESLPYTPNGKIDTKKLPLPKINQEEKTQILPRNEIDTKLINILKELLNINSISIDDNLFDLGGDSLLAINLCAQIKNEFNCELYVKDILEHPIIQEISNIISLNATNIKQEKIVPIPKAKYYEVSSAQKRIYFASSMAGEKNILYNMPGGIILDGHINKTKLEQCFNKLLNRHESLRTYFEVENNNVVQKIIDFVDFKLDVLENQNFNNLDLLFKDFVKPFNLGKAPLFKVKLVCFENNKSVLFLDMHHIICDGTSLSILTEDLCNLYNNKELQKLKITYKDYAAFEKEKLALGKLKEAENFWVGTFKGSIPILNLPTKTTRPAIQSFEGKKIYANINKNTMQKINILAKAYGATPYMITLAVYYILLSKYTSGDDIVIGTPALGRDTQDTNNIVGMFVNSLAVREKIDNTLSFKNFVLKLKENLLKCYKYQTYPFDELVNQLNIKRDPSRNPLFDTMFTYQNNGFKAVHFENINAKYYTPDTKVSKFDLSLEIIPNNQGAQISLEYVTQLFDETFIYQILKHYLNILNAVLENPDVRLSNINMLSEEEKNKILYNFNNTKMDYPKEKTITQLFERQVEKTPNNIALVFEDKNLTYQELNEKANSLAFYLRKSGIGPNDLVGIMVNRSFEMIICMLAILKAGGAYIPIDPTYPKERVDYMLSNSKAKILLTKNHLFTNTTFENKLSVDLSNTKIYELPSSNLTNINNSEDLAYIIYTSGSTGLPKGVMLTHRNINNFINGITKILDLNLASTIASITTISFDIFVLESLLPLQNGLKVVIANEKEQTNVKLFNELCIKNNVNIIQTTPSRIQSFIMDESYTTFLQKASYVLIGGEAFPPSLLNKLKQICRGKIYNMYGPTETAVWSTTKDLTNENTITIGKPIANTEVYVLDDYHNLLPCGVYGELYISGDGVCKGYFNDIEKTNKNFVPNPFVPNSVMYKTGDLCVMQDDGNLKYLERIDNQVKIRGLRIELGEIESLIRKFPHIKKVTVIKQVLNNRDFISAYFVAEKRISISELRKYLSTYLPKYMVPSYFTVLEDLPYTPNGKIDKKALPVPAEILDSGKQTYVAPKTKLQKQLVNIWENILNISPIGINDNFFDLGGDSILAMNLNVELLQITNKISYSDIFYYPTIAELEIKINSNDNKPILNKIENLSENYLNVLNNTSSKNKIKSCTPTNILLTGSTGFLGIHILEQFIKNDNCNIYCIVRNEPGLTARAKLHQKLNYYFGNKYDDLIDKKIFALTGNISYPGFGLNQEDLLKLASTVDTVINCAARVTHFGNYTDFYNSNVKSVKYIIDFCKSFNKRMYQISTMSVSGTQLDSSYPLKNKTKKTVFDESCLYIGQNLENVYNRSKFEAECYVLDAISNGLDAYILRMGNLMPRLKDGVFQENTLDNAFVNKLVTFISLGAIPDYVLHDHLEFTPVDMAAKSIYKIITNPSATNRIFHLYNHNYILVNQYLKMLQKLNYNIKVLTDSKFKEKINETLKDEKSKFLLNSLINDFNKDLHLDYKTDIIKTSKFTVKYLKHTHFKWPRISNKYLTRFIKILRKVI